METRSYNPFEGDTVYDLAGRLYNDVPLGMTDLIALNPGILLDDAHAYGPVLYSVGLKRKAQIISVPIQTQDPVWITREGQSHYDLAIQLYGSTDGLAKILGNLPSLDLDVPTGTQLSYPFERTQNSLFFLRTLVSTWVGHAPRRLLENASFRLLEDGSYRLLE